MRASLSLLLLLGLSAPAAAQIADGNVRLDAHADLYYAYDLNDPAGRQRPYATTPARHNEFAVGLALVRASYAADRVRGTVALGTGTYVEANYAAEPPLLQHVQEAYAGVRLAEGLWVDAGAFYSHIGSETPIPAQNLTYSRSLVAEYSPFYEAGVRSTYAPSDRVTASVLVLNGWQNLRETNGDKALGTQLTVKLTPSVTANWSTFLGNEAPDGQPRQTRLFNDVYVTAALSPTVDVAATFDVGRQPNAAADDTDTWYGAALVGRVRLSAAVALSGRVETFQDERHVLVGRLAGADAGFRATGGSLGLDVAPAPNVLFRLEGRLLASPDRVFPSTNDGGAFRTSAATLTAGLSVSL